MKAPGMTQREIIAALRRAGFEIVRERGTHKYLRRGGGRVVCVPADGGRTLPKGTFGRICRQAGLSAAEVVGLKKGEANGK